MGHKSFQNFSQNCLKISGLPKSCWLLVTLGEIFYGFATWKFFTAGNVGSK